MRERKPGRARGWRRAIFLPLAIVGSVFLAATLVTGFIVAAELSRLTGDSYASYRQNVVDQAAALGRLIFATQKAISGLPREGESAEEGRQRRLASFQSILSYAPFLPKADSAFIRELLADDPLLLADRLEASDLDVSARLDTIGRLVAGAADGTKALDESLPLLEAEARRLMRVLETRETLLVQLGDYFYQSSRDSITHVRSHSRQLGLLEILSAASLALALAIYVKSLVRTQAELRRHRDHLDELVARRTAELSEANARLREEATARERAQVELKRALLEKEELLKEVYHRVKNNLSMVNGLISLQMDEASPEAILSLEDLQSRIAVVSAIYERLHRSKDLENVDLADYLKGLVGDIVAAFRRDPESIEVKVAAPTIRLPAGMMITLGLIINEIAVNSLKYSFKNRDAGSISILASFDGGRLELSIKDDGDPPKDPAEILQSNSLGNRLVRSLCGQLKGEMELRLEGGTGYLFRFPAPAA